MPPIIPEDLSDEVRGILGQPTDPFARLNEQPVCNPDARVTAQALGAVRPRIRPAYIRNARKGDLIMSPGGREGVIGALLWELDPSQLYSHMGIMTRDYVEIRHATFSEERLKKFPSHLGLPEDGMLRPQKEFFPATLDTDLPPTDAFQEHALKFGWPGTITQSVHTCWLNWRYSMIQHDMLGRPNNFGLRVFIEDAENGMEAKPAAERLTIKDAALGDLEYNAFKINAMTFGTVRMDDGQIVYPIVVKPCVAQDTNEVRNALERIADASAAIRGHYRFFCYTDATIAWDDAHRGPPLFEETEPDPACTGQGSVRPTTSTIPVVCSTLIWAAVERINGEANAANLPQILLHGPSNEDMLRHTCGEISSYMSPSWADRVEPGSPDGLYFYGDSERMDAASALFKHNREQVTDIVLRSADLLASVKREIGRSEAVTTLWDVAKLITLFGFPSARLLLDLSDDAMARLIVLLSDMPEDVAQQLCNAFANNDCRVSAKDSTAWRDNPGTGTTVSPDNIIRSWSLPVGATPELISGVYGFNENAEIIPPQWWGKPPPDTTWQISQGVVHGNVRVLLVPDNGAPEIGVQGATVRIGGQPVFRSGPNGWAHEIPLPEGTYWCDAHWRDNSLDQTVESEGQIETIALEGSAPVIIIRIKQPPPQRRRIWFSGTAHLINRHAGADIPLLDIIIDDWEKDQNIDSRHLPDALMDKDAFGFPDEPRFKEIREAARKIKRALSLTIEDWGSAEVEMTLRVQGNGSIDIELTAGMRHGGETEWTGSEDFNVAVDQSKVFRVDIRQGIWPARANIELTIHNSRL